MAVGTGVAAGAIQASGEIVAAGDDIAKNAAQTVAAITTGATPEGSAESEDTSKRKGQGGEGS
jgi:hypothetical protein